MKRSVLLLALVGLVGWSSAAQGGSAGTLGLHGSFDVKFNPVACPPGTSSSVGCYLNAGRGLVPGLGGVAEAYTQFVVPTTGECVVTHADVVLTVAGKGELTLAVRDDECQSLGQANTTSPYTVTGGSGVYSGASGSGQVVQRTRSERGGSGTAVDTYSGTLTVPGLDFDVAPPTLSKATDRTVKAPRKAKRMPVTYKVTAQDEVDGAVAVVCKPRSGSRFKIGKTRVTCSATDSSGNMARATFVVTVKRP